MSQLENEIKALVIEALGLEDITPADIDNDAELFGDGLGLDSVDALELGLALQKRYGITIDPETRNMRGHFATITNLSEFVSAQRSA
ncbi:MULTISPECIES: phosphopantetheine-binding protein [unclassified Achromobacter]|uniref:phosphopantetheine-binding protein n=1 Tax=unclassified Achromobacter TaxID=2626865 RepID=UPI000B51E33E|nr:MULTISPECIES: phosphopantetheine-binding protein [unclassified Achromobacter]OWT76836.1 acyl carrier protein [Achromobacter sp. HZ28]OWT77716.1 acyl carrier protein [Achromobacter sp. HZ34]